jgi:hypothetical protein
LFNCVETEKLKVTSNNSMIFVYLNVNMSLLLSFFKTVKIKYFDNKNGIECEQFKIVITIKEQFVFFLLLLFME